MGELLYSEDKSLFNAYEYFSKEFEKIVGMSIYEFKNTAIAVSETNYAIMWSNDNYGLVYSYDDLFYRLYSYL